MRWIEKGGDRAYNSIAHYWNIKGIAGAHEKCAN